ncbi:MAG: LysM peptidoglycan-binding domain-containing protein [Epulopiscium sp.]|nr:LysM peptidoglycan-binding domain-containing protein [Candidatus Epulonipiscium sp.]
MQKKKILARYRFILLVVLFICSIQIFSIVFIYSSTGNQRNSPIERYEQISIRRGDSLWKIAQNHKPQDLSTSKYVAYIKEFNHLKSNELYAGDSIIIPIYKPHEY